MTRADEAMSRLDLASEIWGIDGYFHRAWEKRGFHLLMPFPWSAHAIVDGPDEAIAEAGVAALRRVGLPHGTEIEPVVPTLTRGAPFDGLEPIMLGPTGDTRRTALSRTSRRAGRARPRRPPAARARSGR